MKYTIAAILATFTVNASAIEIKEIPIPTVCTESKDFYKHLGDYKTIIEYKDKTSGGATLTDKILASKTKNAIFVIRENHEIGGVCIFTMFELEKPTANSTYRTL